MAFFSGFQAEKRVTPPPKLHPVMATRLPSIRGSLRKVSSALYASSTIMAVVTEICSPTVEVTFRLLKLCNAKVAIPIERYISMYSK